MSLWCIGDVHGKTFLYEKVCSFIRKQDPEALTVQVGDLGFGFPKFTPPILSKNDYFITGNHDNYKSCQSMPNYLGQYGFKKNNNQEFFFLSGAESIDRMLRHEGEDWWVWEELNYQELSVAINEYQKNKPKIMITHDCPYIVYQNCFPYRNLSRTVNALTNMWEINKPEIWIFGHHHKSIDIEIDGTRFICLNELEFKKII